MQKIEQLIEAAASNDLMKMAKLISDGIDINRTNSHGITPLMQAAIGGHIAAVEMLIDRKSVV